jgi:hypothetical protein
MAKPLSRRHFGKNIAIAAGAFAGSTLLRGPRVRAQNNEYANLQIIDAAYTFMQDFQWTLDQSPDPFANNINWHGFLGATYSTISVLRQHGMDDWMNQEAPDAAWLAWMEGGWDQFWALMTIPIVGMWADQYGDNAPNFRTPIASNIWMYSNGPISSEYGVPDGWAERPPWPGSFQVFGQENSMNARLIDDATRETVGIPQDVPWFDVLDPYVPNVVLGPLPTVWIWQTRAVQCKQITDAQIALETAAGGTLIFVNIDRKGKIILLIAGAILRVMKNHFC